MSKNLTIYLQENYSAKSINSYQCRIKAYWRYCNHHKQGKLQDVLQYLQQLRTQGKHPKTIKNYLHSIKIYYTFLQVTNQRKDHPCRGLQLKDKIDKSIRIEQLYSTEELEAFLEVSESHKWLMVSLLVYQAITASEMSSLQVQQVNLQQAELQLANRSLALRANQILALQAQIKNKQRGDFVFTTKTGKTYPTSEINAHINRNRDKKITPLKIRQSVIKNLLKNNNLRVVQVFAGHKVSSTTQEYQTTDLEQLKVSIDKHHPLQ